MRISDWSSDVCSSDLVASVHRGFVEAGSDIVLTNTFGGNARRLMLHQAPNRVRELNEEGARIARGAADAAGRQVLVAGPMGPTGDLLAPVEIARCLIRERVWQTSAH